MRKISKKCGVNLPNIHQNPPKILPKSIRNKQEKKKNNNSTPKTSKSAQEQKIAPTRPVPPPSQKADPLGRKPQDWVFKGFY